MASTQEFFEGLPDSVPAERIAGMNNTYVFDIEGAGTWTVSITDGAISVDRRRQAGETVTFSASEEIFEKIRSGEPNPTTAYMTGSSRSRATWARR